MYIEKRFVYLTVLEAENQSSIPTTLKRGPLAAWHHGGWECMRRRDCMSKARSQLGGASHALFVTIHSHRICRSTLIPSKGCAPVT
jgi:hypothetical protein